MRIKRTQLRLPAVAAAANRRHHTPRPTPPGTPTASLVDHNVANDNGLSTPTAPDASAGSGVIIASPIPNGVLTGNTITQNSFKDNGHGGVVVHSHAPGADLSGNVISKNLIGTNNLRTDENDLQPRGIYLGSASALTITVTDNQIHDDYYGIFASGPVTVAGGNNHFHNVTAPLGLFPTFYSRTRGRRVTPAASRRNDGFRREDARPGETVTSTG